MRRFKPASHKVYHGGNSSNILKSVFCGAVSRRDIATKHRLDFSFYFSGGVFRVRAPSPVEKWAQNTA